MSALCECLVLLREGKKLMIHWWGRPQRRFISPPLVSIPSQTNLVHTLAAYYFMIHFNINIILPFTPKLYPCNDFYFILIDCTLWRNKRNIAFCWIKKYAHDIQVDYYHLRICFLISSDEKWISLQCAWGHQQKNRNTSRSLFRAKNVSFLDLRHHNIERFRDSSVEISR
jgi:hypothetical protein